MPQWNITSLVVAYTVLCSGCATILVRSDSPKDQKYLYPATVADASCLVDCGVKGTHPLAIQGSTSKVSPPIRVAFGVGSLVDFPFSLVSDTLFIPYDLYRINANKDEYQGEQAAPRNR